MDGEGFWSNRNPIRRSFEENHLWVIRVNDDAVAFQVGDYAADILCVRKDQQRRGFGRAMFEAALVRAKDNNVNVLTGECSPQNSLPFWKKQGFELYKDSAGLRGPIVRRILYREHELPESLPKVEVAITFFPQAILYCSEVSPLIDNKMCGVLYPSAKIALPRRVIAHIDNETDHRDLVVKIVVHGNERYFDKAKRPEAKALGVQRDRIGNSFYIDKIRPEVSQPD